MVSLASPEGQRVMDELRMLLEAVACQHADSSDDRSSRSGVVEDRRQRGPGAAQSGQTVPPVRSRLGGYHYARDVISAQAREQEADRANLRAREGEPRLTAWRS